MPDILITVYKKYLYPKKDIATSLWPLGIFILLTLILLITNHTSGTYLLGWDNLPTEFNSFLNIKRAIFSVWEEYQGLGLPAGMAHAADLPRQIFVLFLSVLLPQSIIRYVFHFLMIATGMTGVYVLLRNIIFKDRPYREFAAVIGSIFYLCNLGTIQYFYVPFEPYSVFWGFFPWEIYVFFLYLRYPTRRNLLLCTIVNILAIPQAVVQTIFLVYGICLSLISVLFIANNRSSAAIKQVLLLGGIIFTLNAFWLIPNVYYTVTNLNVTQNAMQNRMATEKFFQMNKYRGNIPDFALLREFYFDYSDYNYATNSYDFLMKSWRNYFSHPLPQILGYLFFIGVIIGLVQKNRYRRYLLGLFCICVVVFLSNTIGFSQLNDIFRSIPIVNQIFRNPFTKFIVPTICIFSLGFAACCLWIFELAAEKFSPRIAIGSFIAICIVLLAYTYPIFTGNFIDPQMRVSLPKEYQQLFSYLNTQDKDARIMNLPQGSFWGWEYYNWGLHGSGFLWYGIEQPIMDRAFDVWSTPSENYYWELSYAITKNDSTLFDQILEKYQIHYILFDDSLLNGVNLSPVSIGVDQKQLVEHSKKVTLVKKFGDIALYKTNLQTNTKNNMAFFTHLPSVTKTNTFDTQDTVYAHLGNYYSPQSSNSASFVFPFGSLFSSRFQDEETYHVTDMANTYALTTSIPAGKYTLTIPSYRTHETRILVKIFVKRQPDNHLAFRLEEEQPAITIDGKTIPTKINAIEYITNQVIKETSFFVDVNNTDYFLVSQLSKAYTPIGETYIQSSDIGNYIKLYATTNVTVQNLPINQFEKAHACGKPHTNSFTSSGAINNQLVMTVKNTAACAVYTGVLKPQNALMETTFSYQSKTDEYPQFCYFANSPNSCLNKKDTITYGFSKNLTGYSSFFEGDELANDKVYFQMILEGQADSDKNQQKQMRYSHISVLAYPYITGSELSLGSLDTTDTQVPVAISTSSTIELMFPKIYNGYSYTNPVARNVYKTTPLNFDKLIQGQYKLQQGKENKINLLLEAENTTSYLLFQANNLLADQGYLLSVDTKNIQGFPLTLSVYSYKDGRNYYYYTFMQKNSNLLTNYYVLPPIYPFDSGINVLLGNSSYNNSPTINGVQDANIYPIPYYLTTGIYLHPTTQDTKGILVNGNAQKQNYNKYIVSNLSPAAKFIMLSQAYDPGWHAYQTSSLNFFTTLFPFLFGKEIPHVMVNNWENGWDLNGITGHNFVIVYLPQYLEYIGFLLGFITLWFTILHPLLAGSFDRELRPNRVRRNGRWVKRRPNHTTDTVDTTPAAIEPPTEPTSTKTTELTAVPVEVKTDEDETQNTSNELPQTATSTSQPSLTTEPDGTVIMQKQPATPFLESQAKEEPTQQPQLTTPQQSKEVQMMHNKHQHRQMHHTNNPHHAHNKQQTKQMQQQQKQNLEENKSDNQEETVFDPTKD